jgi:hypothetical protein
MKLIAILLVAFMVANSASGNKKKECKLPVIRDFSLTRFLGTWFNVQRYVEDSVRLVNFKCVFSVLTPINDTFFNFFDSAVNMSGFQYFLNFSYF